VTVVPSMVQIARRPPSCCLRVIIDGDDEVAKTKKKQEALAEHVASHAEDAGLAVDDFNWIERTLVRAGFHGWLTRRGIIGSYWCTHKSASRVRFRANRTLQPTWL
jgi:hypothetical protein